jgi:hypothetical protein
MDSNCCHLGCDITSCRCVPIARQNRNVQVGSKLFETVEQFKYLGTTLMNQNFIYDEIKNRLKLGNAGYHSVQNLLSLSFAILKCKD